MKIRRFPPTFMPVKPWSKPGIMRPRPTGKLAGSGAFILGFPSSPLTGLPSLSITGVGCLSHESKTTPSAARQPVYFTLYIFMGTASAPVPTLMSWYRSEKAVLGTPGNGVTPGGYLTGLATAAAVCVLADGLAAAVAGLAAV